MSSSISIRIPEEALDLINKARRLGWIDESLSAFMVAASDVQTDVIMSEYRREKKKNRAFARIPIFPDFAGPFPNGGDKRMVHIAITEDKKNKFRNVAELLNQNGTQFLVLSSVLRALSALHDSKQRRRRSKSSAAA